MVGQTATVDGRIVDARSIDGLARLVLASPAGGGLEFPQPTEYERLTMKAAIAANQEIVDEAPIEAWLPRWTPAGGTETALLDCSEVYHPKEWAGPQILSVLTVGDDLATLNGVGVVTSGETVYASSTGLYVATQKVAQPELDDDGGLIWPEGDAASETTALHRFDISTKGAAVYQGSGEVPGHLINQYAMSEANGDLRVATTVGFGGRGVPMPMPVEDCPECAVSEPAIAPGEPAPAEVPGDDDRSTGVRSMLSVLRLKGDALEQIGRLDGLGPNEQIQSVRFVGARAYVVTFRQTDPLYVIDVADPTKPTLLGELKEPGFSSYLHPVGTDRMLGVGSSGTEDGQITGAKVTLYDTSDPTKPRAVTTVPITGGYSSAGGDAHAFNWDPARKLAFVPLSMSSDTEMVEGVAVYRVDGDAVTWVGFLSHRDHQGAPGPVIDCGGPTVECMPYPYRQSPVVDRVVIIGDSIYAASLAGVSRHAVDTLAETAWVGWS